MYDVEGHYMDRFWDLICPKQHTHIKSTGYSFVPLSLIVWNIARFRPFYTSDMCSYSRKE